MASQVAAWSFAVAESGLTRYLEEIRRFPMLEPQDEFMLAKRWREHGDRDAAHKLVTSHLRLVAKIAMGYRGYGLPISEVISEGNVGLMQAVKRFEPDKGFRLATYAMWWIKAAIQEYILRSWSLVKMGTTANQKKLFFNLRKAKSKISALEEGDLRPDQVKLIAKRLGVTEQDADPQSRWGLDRWTASKLLPYRAAKYGSSHYPVCPKPATTLSRKYWHSAANGAVLRPLRARVAVRDPAPPAAWPRWG
jgi:RNA polymerase sigma-32 factor